MVAALSRIEVEKEREKVKHLAIETIKQCLEQNLIKPTNRGISGQQDEDDD